MQARQQAARFEDEVARHSREELERMKAKKRQEAEERKRALNAELQ